MTKAIWNGVVLAESDQTIVVEGNHYFPPESVDRQYFQASETHTVCPWKGVASYYDVAVDGQINRGAAWYYPDPRLAARDIKVSALIGIPAGRALGLHDFRGKRLVEFLILAPIIVPTLAAAMGIHVAFIRYGLADSLLGVILVHLIPVVPYMTLIMSSVFANYSPEYEEQAAPWAPGHSRFSSMSPGRRFGRAFWPAACSPLLFAGANTC